MTRANALIDILVSRPLRWLSGNAYKLDNFSPLDMSIALGLVHDLFVEAAADGSVLLDPNLDIFKSIRDKQPLFAELHRFMFEEDHILAPDGKTPHLVFQLVREELLNPKDPTNMRSRSSRPSSTWRSNARLASRRSLTRSWRWRAIFRSPKASMSSHGRTPSGSMQRMTVCRSLSLPAGTMCCGAIRGSRWRQRPRLCMRCARRATARAAGWRSCQRKRRVRSSRWRVLQWTRCGPSTERTTLSSMTTTKRSGARIRSSNSTRSSSAMRLHSSFFDRWKKRGVSSLEDARAKIADMSNQEKLDWLREQIEMRVIGLGFEEFNP